MARVFTIAELPDALLQSWLQHLRDFDARNPGCHFEVAADVPEMTLAQMVEAARVNPNLTFTQIFKRGRP